MEVSVEKVIWATIALIATTALTIVITRLVNRFLDRRSQLLVTVSINEKPKSPKVYEQVMEWYRKALTPEERSQDRIMGVFGAYYTYFKAENYIRLELKNNTVKKITNLTMSVNSGLSDVVMQVNDDGPLVSVSSKEPTALPDMQPRREITLHLIPSSMWLYTPAQFREALVFSADEHVHARYVFPMPTLFATRFKKIGFFILSFLIPAVVVFTLLTVFGVK